jgi:hypothetical protein
VFSHLEAKSMFPGLGVQHLTPGPLDTALLFRAVSRIGMVVSFVVQTSNFFRGKIYPQHFQVASVAVNSLANFNRFNPVLKIQAMTAESIQGTGKE